MHASSELLWVQRRDPLALSESGYYVFSAVSLPLLYCLIIDLCASVTKFLENSRKVEFFSCKYGCTYNIKKRKESTECFLFFLIPLCVAASKLNFCINIHYYLQFHCCRTALQTPPSFFSLHFLPFLRLSPFFQLVEVSHLITSFSLFLFFSDPKMFPQYFVLYAIRLLKRLVIRLFFMYLELIGSCNAIRCVARILVP